MNQPDDKSREALKSFLKDREGHLNDFLSMCVACGEFWKGRVFLELLWEYEARLPRLVPPLTEKTNGDPT